MSLRESGIYIHEEWKGMTQPVGLVVEPIVLDRLGIFPEKNIRVVSDLQRRLEALFEDRMINDDFLSAVRDFKEFCKEVLDWQDTDLLKPENFNSDTTNRKICVFLEDYEEILQPDWIVPEITGKDFKKNIQILVKELEVGTPFDRVIKNPENKKQWEATPQQRFERLLKESENPIGILWNGIALRLIYAPRGESSGHITFPLEPMISVDGRPIIGALEMLLGPDRLFEGGTSNSKLLTLMEQSRKEQNEVSTRLSEQVLEALWILVRGCDEAEKKANLVGKTFLNNLPETDPSHIYGGLITILLRLVFLLYSEDEELMPKDTLYAQNYSVSGLAAKLRQDRVNFQNTMEARYGAWGSLLSLFRLVFDGGGAYESYLPARHGDLFDPDSYPFLEGRIKGTSYTENNFPELPLISDDVVEKVLEKLLILDGQILSYRSLDVEQIGSVYEGIMGFTVERIKSPSVGILYRPPRQKITISFVFNVEEFLSRASGQRESWLKNIAGVDLKLTSKILKNLKDANNLSEVCEALAQKLSPYTPRGLKIGSLILQPTAERRRSGSHYTPRSLSEPIVEESFRPWLEKHNYSPSSKDILSLKVCDPAMGSGAFLVAVCRFMAGHLVRAWEKDGYPPEFDTGFDKDIYARRLIAQQCLYGVDKNEFAVNLAKLSLWLVTLSKDLPFTFLDHSLKCGDSLIGYSVQEIKRKLGSIQLGLINFENQFLSNLSYERKKMFSIDNRDDLTYDSKKKLLDQQFNSCQKIRLAGDLMVASFFNSKKAKEREAKEKEYIQMLNSSFKDEILYQSMENICIELSTGDKAIKPFHWDLEFPEVFDKNNKGFDVFVGNPPFAGKNTIARGNHENIIDWFKFIHKNSHGNADLSAHFFRRSFNLLREGGSLGLIATNTISEGDTRGTGLKSICMNNGTIYSCIKRKRWPGAATVIISIIHIYKGEYLSQKILNKKIVPKITAFLFPSGKDEDPYLLSSNIGKCFVGSYVLGKGFTFDDTQLSDNETPNIPSPIAKFNELMKSKSNHKVLFPYIGGNEVSKSSSQSAHRYVINFGERNLEECKKDWTEVFNILEKKAKGTRKSHSTAKWWQFERLRTEMYKAVDKHNKVLAVAQTSKYKGFVEVDKNMVFDQKLIIFPINSFVEFSILQSSIHLDWALFFGGSQGDGPVYNPSDCYQTFPFPTIDEKDSLVNELLMYGEEYYQFRAKIMIEENIGITDLYNLFHDPKDSNKNINELRKLHIKLDSLVMALYGWENLLNINYGFNIDYLDFDEDLNLSKELKSKIDNEDLFFKDAESACNFQDQFKLETSSKRRIAWNFGYSPETREKIIGNLLHKNNELFVNQKNQNSYPNDEKNNNKIENFGREFQIGLDI